MEEVRKFFRDRDRLARHLSIDLVHVGEGEAEARLVLGEEHQNAVGLAHGGTLMSLADVALGAAANSSGKPALAVSVSMSFLKPGISGTLTARAKRLMSSRRLATYEVVVSNDSQETIATMQGTVYVKQGGNLLDM